MNQTPPSSTPVSGFPRSGVPVSTTADIHLDRLQHNVASIQKRLKGVEIMGVVKADAYGHGSVAISQKLISLGVRKLAVATVAEAVNLRDAGIEAEILVFAPPLADRAHYYPEFDLQAIVDSDLSLEVLEKAKERVRCHVKVDTGMGRLGQVPDAALDLIRRVDRSGSLELSSVWTHFSRADEPDSDFTSVQFDRFMALMRALGGAPAPLHTAASAAMYTFPPSIDSSLMSMARIGIALYGLLDLPGQRPPSDLIPVLEFKTRISALKTVPAGSPISYGARWTAPGPRVIATVSAGYADGVPRELTNRGRVRIGENLYPMVGTVCMDMFMVDLGSPDSFDNRIEVGTEVILFGRKSPTCFEVADLCSSITYAQVCGITNRVPRRTES